MTTNATSTPAQAIGLPRVDPGVHKSMRSRMVRWQRTWANYSGWVPHRKQRPRPATQELAPEQSLPLTDTGLGIFQSSFCAGQKLHPVNHWLRVRFPAYRVFMPEHLTAVQRATTEAALHGVSIIRQKRLPIARGRSNGAYAGCVVRYESLSHRAMKHREWMRS